MSREDCSLNSKIILVLFVALAVLLGSAFQLTEKNAFAAVTSVDAPDELETGATGTVTITVAPASTETLTIEVVTDAGVAGLLSDFQCQPVACDADPDSGSSVTIDTLGITEVTLTLRVSCTVPGFVDVLAYEGAEAPVVASTGCIALGQIVLTATPNLLPCQGGTAELEALTIGPLGDVFDDNFFNFQTTAGLLERTSNNTADLTLGPAQITAIVTATTVDEVSGELVSSTITVSLACNDFVSVVVTANPNVIECGGTSVITATARDANGHVVKGVGFHFATDMGLLVVHPNNAANEEGIAALTLQPGMTSATVTVSVGTTLGTVEGTTTVQQFCPGVVPGQNASAAPGQVLLNSSNNNLVCGEQVFVGMKIRDSKGQVPPDGTAVNLLATSGLLEPTTTTTINGTANVVYTAAAINGDVRITAAAGDSYGFTILKVKCATTSGTGSAGAAPCTPIGDGVCIAPPNTGGNRITPPNTGEAGLK